MADPLSLVASVITVASAAASISKAISGLRILGELPARLHVLKNETADLEVVLRQMGAILEKRQMIPDAEHASIHTLLRRANDKLSELSKLLNRIADQIVGSKAKMINRAAIWWKEKSQLQTLQEELRAVRVALNMMLGASHLYGRSIT